MPRRPLSLFSPGRILVLTFILGTTVCLLAPTAEAAQEKGYAPSRQDVFQMVVDEALRLNFSPELALAVARTESDFDAHAESHAGARGVMQIMPRTGRDVLNLRPSQLWDARTNIRGGITFLQDLIRSYDGRVDIALSHYNGGSAVRRPNGSLRIIPATRNYVKKVKRFERQYRRDQQVLTARINSKKRHHRQKDVIIVRSAPRKPLKQLRRQSVLTAQKLDHLDRQLDRISGLLAQGRLARQRNSGLQDW